MKDLNEIQQLWSAHDQKLQQQMSINIDLLRKINLDKIERKMNSLVLIKAVALGFYLIVTILLVSYVVIKWPNLNLVISGTLISTWALAICFTSIQEIRMALSIRFTDPTIILQRHLMKYRSTIIRYLRIGVWVLPLHLAFVVLFFDLYFGIDIIQTGNQTWLISQFLFSLLVMTPLAVWLYRKLIVANVDKKWMYRILKGNGSQLLDSLQLLNEIKDVENA